jgi:hypothetical protein
LCSSMSNAFPKVLKLSCEVSECKTLAAGRTGTQGAAERCLLAGRGVGGAPTSEWGAVCDGHGTNINTAAPARASPRAGPNRHQVVEEYVEDQPHSECQGARAGRGAEVLREREDHGEEQEGDAADQCYAHAQGLTLVHYSAQLEPCLTQKHTLNTPYHPLNTPQTTPTPNCTPC